MARVHDLPMGIGLPRLTALRREMDEAVTGFVITQRQALLDRGIPAERAWEIIIETLLIAAGKIQGNTAPDLASFEQRQINLACLFDQAARERLMKSLSATPRDVAQRRPSRLPGSSDGDCQT